jgi:integrating conjugative element protein (TIGR03757 family)
MKRFNTACFIVLGLMSIGGSGVSAAQPSHTYPGRIEVFTTTEIPVAGNPLAVSPEIGIQTYELDGIQTFENRLSHDLPTDPKQARKIALQRFQSWDETTKTQLQQAAMGLAKAMQYGIDRYPAIVFDGRAVVYGLTDLGTALDRYRAWRQGRPAQ